MFKGKFEYLNRNRKAEVSKESIKQYMKHVMEEHLPSISENKKMQLERYRTQLIQSKLPRRPENPKMYNVETYKQEKTKSLDWSGLINPMVPEPPKPKEEFIKIDYLRFESKKEAAEMISKSPYSDMNF